MKHTPRFIQRHHSNALQIRAELLQGLHAPIAHTSPKYLYDELGSKLFEAITCIPEYYPTRVEASIFRAQADALAKLVPKQASLIDLGAGNCQKAANLFAVFEPARYVAVDISVEFLRGALECLQRQFPDMDMVGVGLDFSEHLQLPDALGLHPNDPRVLFYPGSSIGNFTPNEALAFLKQVHACCAVNPEGGLLIGVDLVKDARVLQAAYDDELGVTAAFNRNLLLHLNTLIGSNFKLADWAHVGLYNTELNRIEMHLEAVRDVVVTWPEGSRHFAAGERIHTENSYKWTIDAFTALLHDAGFGQATVLTDPQHQFAVCWAPV
ncbi:L-histidine N(alpha)-methyltransferase [Limnobacter humi]|uniref:L-histidine N(Alpha)-methyltransferase n=1 Tax=Limnobacter humi TaxID=1778671 RepID=A0ABT1WF45_9BURK|nr:L-histidine N(alpha)-methyltransferase [Limnobacter humi]MCQ8895059.1 L-histidine N(alpha)-methyltransferase [Limnobacter humi]